MNELFLKILNMSISAGWVVLAVIVLRFVLKKAPKWVNVLLWGMVAVRLICPVSLESVFSLIPSAETIPEEVISGPSFEIQTGVPAVDTRVNDYLGDRYFEGVTVPVNNGVQVMSVLSVFWLAGMAVLLLYAAISYLRLHRKVETAVLLRDNIFQSEAVESPFVLGIIKPRIFLPFKIEGNDLEYVVAHEQAHIRRKDHWWKPFGFLLLIVYWFHPLLWLAYVLLCRDIELACDEKVIKTLNSEEKADYSRALLVCSIGNGRHRRMISACPLAFGEVGVKERVKSVLHYKKPGFWVILLTIVVCIIVAVCFLTNPKSEQKEAFSVDDDNVGDTAGTDLLPVDEEDMLASLENYYKEELPASAASPYVLFADPNRGMIVFGSGKTTLTYVTGDGGTTWEQAGIPEEGKSWHEWVRCATAISATEYCVGYGYWGVNDGTDFYLTKDSGKTWTRLSPDVAIPEEITSTMRYAEAAEVYFADNKLVVQVSCKTESGKPWSIEVLLASEDMGETWEVIEIWEKETDAE